MTYSKIRACVCVCTCAQAFCCVCLFVTLWTVARWAPLFDSFPGKNPGVGCQNRFPLFEMRVSVHAQSCPAVCDLMDCSPPVFSVHGFPRQEYWNGFAISCSRGSSWPRDWTCVSCVSLHWKADLMTDWLTDWGDKWRNWKQVTQLEGSKLHCFTAWTLCLWEFSLAT